MSDLEFTVWEDDFAPSPEDERNHWSEPGHFDFYVLANRHDVFEIEVEEHSGCAGGALETFCGPEYLLEHLGINKEALREGWTYQALGLTVTFYRGDGWMTDDDAEYQYEHLVPVRNWKRWAWQKIENAWWFSIGWRLSQWRAGR